MLTNQDIKRMLEVFVTKQDLNQLEERLATKEEIRSYSAIVEKAVAGFRKVEEEQLAHSVEHDDIREDLRRIKNMPAIAHELKKQK